MKITIYELLGMIKDDKAPKKIKYDDRIWVKNSNNNDYTDSFGTRLFDSYLILVIIDNIVEILDKIEEKKIPEKLKNYYDENLEEYVVETYIKGIKYQEIFNSRYDEMIISKINEVLDYLKSKGE